MGAPPMPGIRGIEFFSSCTNLSRMPSLTPCGTTKIKQLLHPRFRTLACMTLGKWGVRLAMTVGLAAGCGGPRGGQLEPRFVAVHNAMTAVGLSQSGPIHEGALRPGGEARLHQRLSTDKCYTFVALGERDVRDIDIRVLAEGGDEVGRDTTHDRQAAAQVCPEHEGEYELVVAMASGHGSYMLTSWSKGASGEVTRRGGGAGTCGSPFAAPAGRPLSGNTAQGSSRMQGSCANGNAPEHVYKIDVERRSQVSVRVEAGFDASLYLLGECGQAQSEVRCNDDAQSGDTSQSRLDVSLDPGTYYAVVDGYGTNAGEYEMLVSMSPLREVRSICAEAAALTAGRSVNGTTEGKPDNFQASCAGGARSADNVFRIEVPQRSRLRVRQQSDHDGALYLRSDCSEATSELACNDDFGDNRHSLVSKLVDPGRYFVFADGFSGSGGSPQGNFALEAEVVPVSGAHAQNDTCQTASNINLGGRVQVDTIHATDDAQGSCGGAGAPDVMHRLKVLKRSRLRVTMSKSEFVGALYVQRTCGDASSEVVCKETPASIPRTNEARLDTPLDPGEYTLVIDGKEAGAFGAAEVEVRLEELQALERTCRRAPILAPGRTVNGSTGTGKDDFQASCASHTQSNDAVYRVKVRRRSRVRITLSSDFDGALHLRRDCTSQTTELACNDDHEDNRHSQVEATLDPGTYYAIVDGFGRGNQGNFSLELSVSSP